MLFKEILIVVEKDNIQIIKFQMLPILKLFYDINEHSFKMTSIIITACTENKLDIYIYSYYYCINSICFT